MRLSQSLKDLFPGVALSAALMLDLLPRLEGTLVQAQPD